MLERTLYKHGKDALLEIKEVTMSFVDTTVKVFYHVLKDNIWYRICHDNRADAIKFLLGESKSQWIREDGKGSIDWIKKYHLPKAVRKPLEI